MIDSGVAINNVETRHLQSRQSRCLTSLLAITDIEDLRCIVLEFLSYEYVDSYLASIGCCSARSRCAKREATSSDVSSLASLSIIITLPQPRVTTPANLAKPINVGGSRRGQIASANFRFSKVSSRFHVLRQLIRCVWLEWRFSFGVSPSGPRPRQRKGQSFTAASGSGRTIKRARYYEGDTLLSGEPGLYRDKCERRD